MRWILCRVRWCGLVCFAMLGACGSGSGGGKNNPGTIEFLETSFDALEGTIVNLRVARSGGSKGVVSVDYATEDGTAVAGSDYTPVSGTLTWTHNVSGNQTISVFITDDGSAEPPEWFRVTLSNASVATLGDRSSATVNVVDDDPFNLLLLVVPTPMLFLRYDLVSARTTRPTGP